MKNTIKLFKVIAIAAVILFTMAACEEPEDTNKGEETLTYKGKDRNGTEWVLKITGDAYELTGDMGVMGLNTSTGTVFEKHGTTYSLKPSVTAVMFTATVSPAGLIELLGSIIWDNDRNRTVPLPGQLTPSGGTGGGNGKDNNSNKEDTPTVVPNNPGVGGNTEENGVQKILVITDITGVSGQITVALAQMEGHEITVVAYNQVAYNSSVTIPLIGGTKETPTLFTDTGYFYIFLFFDVNNTPDNLDDDYIYIYTGDGETPITYNLTETTTIIAFSKFKQQQ